MSPKTVRSHWEHRHRKKYFTLFNIFHQIILKQFTKVAAFPIIQMGEQRHKLTLQFSLHHWSADDSTHHVSWAQPSLEPRHSTSSLGKHFICSTWHSEHKWELVTDGAVGAPRCLHIVLVTSVPSVGNKALHTHSLGKAQNLFPSTGVTEGGSSTTILH